MKIPLAHAVIALMFAGAIAAQSLPASPYVVVRGHAERSLAPDRFEVGITVQKQLPLGPCQARLHTTDLPPCHTA
jgi:uncharacterized protein YggE